VLSVSRPAFDILRPPDLLRLERWEPNIVVNAAAWTDVDGCARDPAVAMRINGQAAGDVAMVAQRVGAISVQVSTNEVFDGLLDKAYTENDVPNPLNPYVESKIEAEE
jgi:dTDP-4-dehydrorhamnose reductase